MSPYGALIFPQKICCVFRKQKFFPVFYFLVKSKGKIIDKFVFFSNQKKLQSHCIQKMF